MERIFYFRAIHSCGRAVIIDSASALQTMLIATATLASHGSASMGEALHGLIRGSGHELAAGLGRLGRYLGAAHLSGMSPGPIEQAPGYSALRSNLIDLQAAVQTCKQHQ